MIKNLLIYISITLIAITTTSCSIVDLGFAIFSDTTTKEIAISDFSSIIVSGNSSVIYTTGKPSLKIVAPDYMIDAITASVTNGVLNVEVSEPHTNTAIFSDQYDIKIYASSPTLSKAEVDKVGAIILNSPINTDSLTMTINGLGEITAKENITCSSKLICSVSGLGVISRPLKSGLIIDCQ